jgi:MarR family 2-MHQ and catechol resistance regulon transcriptional repressor
MPSKYDGTEYEVRALTVYITLTRAASSVFARTTAHLRSHGITDSQFGVLDALYHCGQLKQHELASKLLLSTGNITLVIKNMERAGLITRRRPENDQRSVVVELTQEGRRLIERVLPEHVGGIVNEMAVLTPNQQDALAALCRSVGKRERLK